MKPIKIQIIDTNTPIQYAWLEQLTFSQKPGEFALIPSKDGELECVLFVVSQQFWDFAKLVDALPKREFEIDDPNHLLNKKLAYFAWDCAAYRFDRFTQKPPVKPTLIREKGDATHIRDSVKLVRDLINTPCEQLGPEELQAAMAGLAEKFNGDLKGFVGDELLQHHFPAVHAVGRASHRKPRLMHLTWGNAKNKAICLVGKGVCFDTGGLNIKTGNYMNLMKKDMGGAANVLGLASMIMSENLPIYLHVIIPMVENSISADSYRPGDVIHTRKGLSVEITNTDAEGRVILSDALTYAGEQNPEMIIDFATLTGAARVATGPEMPAYFTEDNTISNKIDMACSDQHDPMWRLPLFEPYREYLKSDIADMTNCGSNGYAGATVAGLFLKSFVPQTVSWLHIDLMAWNHTSKPGRPKGGEAQGIRAVFKFLSEREN